MLLYEIKKSLALSVFLVLGILLLLKVAILEIMAFITKIQFNGVTYDLTLYNKANFPFKTWGNYVQVYSEYPINNNQSACFFLDNYNMGFIQFSFYIEAGVPVADSNILCTLEQAFTPYPSKMLFFDITGKNPILVWTTDLKTIYFDNISTQNYNSQTRNYYVFKFLAFREGYL